MTIIGRFIARIRQKLFVSRIEREIYFEIFPHLNGEANHGYPFTSDDELRNARLAGSLNVKGLLCDIDQAASKMPQAQGEAFRYIAYRNLKEQMTMYLAYAKRREYKECDPRYVATAV